MGIYDGKRDLTLSDVYKRAFSPDPITISADVKIPDEFLEQLKRETEVTDEIKQKFFDVCWYMYEHNFLEIESQWANGKKFSLKMEEAADGKRDNM